MDKDENNGQEKSIAETMGWSYDKRENAVHGLLLGHFKILRELEMLDLTEDAERFDRRRSEIPEGLSPAAQKLMEDMVAESAELTANSIAALQQVAFDASVDSMKPIFGEDAVEAAMGRIRKEAG